jgi:hypothetical protein
MWNLGPGFGGPVCANDSRFNGWKRGTPGVIGWASLYGALISVIVYPAKRLLALWVSWTCAEHVMVHVLEVVESGAPGVFGRAGL